jgi:hypothetical protein
MAQASQLLPDRNFVSYPVARPTSTPNFRPLAPSEVGELDVSIKEPLKTGNWLNRCRSWQSEVIVWLGQLRILGVAVLTFFVAGMTFGFVLAYPSSCLERAVRWTGGMLQVFGVVTVVLKLRAAHDQFQMPTTNFWQWLKRFPRFPPQHVTLHAHDLIHPGPVFSEPRLRVSSGPGASLEQRVVLIEQQFTGLFKEIDRVDRASQESADKFSEALRVESAERKNADKGLSEQIKDVVLGHVYLDWLGVLFVLLGIIATTASTEIASLFGAGPCPSMP